MLIGEKFKIESDSLNVIIYHRQKRRNGDGVEAWRPIAYFSTPQNALKYLVNKEVMDTGMNDLETVCQKINELHGLINTLNGLPELQRATPLNISKSIWRLSRARKG